MRKDPKDKSANSLHCRCLQITWTYPTSAEHSPFMTNEQASTNLAQFNSTYTKLKMIQSLMKTFFFLHGDWQSQPGFGQGCIMETGVAELGDVQWPGLPWTLRTGFHGRIYLVPDWTSSCIRCAHKTMQPPFFFFLVCRAARVALSKTSLTPSLVLAEHSKYV